MADILETESTLTDRYQTTIPETIRRTLRLNKRDKLLYAVQPDGTVVLSRAAPTIPADPALGGFLRFLERDLAARPNAIAPLDVARHARAQGLIEGIEVDLDSELRPEDD
ncbi:MAG: type II toxin-antitoxin system PrlF family antitoxin [Pseudomonadota bacterium]|nr:type II toxin-antitoxin system PrlF family antitoxin [Pseudomonadota bacterium]